MVSRSKVIRITFLLSFCSHFAASLPDLRSRQKKNSEMNKAQPGVLNLLAARFRREPM